MNIRLLKLLLIVPMIFGCNKFDDSHLWDSINSLNSRVERLETICDKMNTNISSLQTIVQALQTNDAIKSVTSLPNGEGYTINFVSGKSINIYNGRNGTNGADGKDGQDGKNGVTPVISVKKDIDGIYYWTVNGEWLIVDGNKVKAVGTDGANGANGTDGKDGVDGEDGIDGENGSDGTDGKDGITPKFKIEDGYWYISYDNEQSWEQLGKATGDNGLNGSDGESFFKGVSIENGYVCFILNDAESTVIKLPFSEEKSLTVNVIEAGTLESVVPKEQIKTLVSLKIIGKINEDDMKFINMRMLSLESLDLAETEYICNDEHKYFFLNPCGLNLPNRTLRKLTTPRIISGVSSPWINIDDCINLEELFISSTSSPNLETYVLGGDTQASRWNNQLKRLEFCIGTTSILSFELNIAETVVLPATISRIKLSQISYFTSKKIQTLICNAFAPPANGINDNDKYDNSCNLDAMVYVPKESVELYKNAPGWKRFKNILPIEE